MYTEFYDIRLNIKCHNHHYKNFETTRAFIYVVVGYIKQCFNDTSMSWSSYAQVKDNRSEMNCRRLQCYDEVEDWTKLEEAWSWTWCLWCRGQSGNGAMVHKRRGNLRQYSPLIGPLVPSGWRMVDTPALTAPLVHTQTHFSTFFILKISIKFAQIFSFHLRCRIIFPADRVTMSLSLLLLTVMNQIFHLDWQYCSK